MVPSRKAGGIGQTKSPFPGDFMPFTFMGGGWGMERHSSKYKRIAMPSQEKKKQKTRYFDLSPRFRDYLRGRLYARCLEENIEGEPNDKMAPNNEEFYEWIGKLLEVSLDSQKPYLLNAGSPEWQSFNKKFGSLVSKWQGIKRSYSKIRRMIAHNFQTEQGMEAFGDQGNKPDKYNRVSDIELSFLLAMAPTKPLTLDEFVQDGISAESESFFHHKGFHPDKADPLGSISVSIKFEDDVVEIPSSIPHPPTLRERLQSTSILHFTDEFLRQFTGLSSGELHTHAHDYFLSQKSGFQTLLPLLLEESVSGSLELRSDPESLGPGPYLHRLVSLPGAGKTTALFATALAQRSNMHVLYIQSPLDSTFSEIKQWVNQGKPFDKALLIVLDEPSRLSQKSLTAFVQTLHGLEEISAAEGAPLELHFLCAERKIRYQNWEGKEPFESCFRRTFDYHIDCKAGLVEKLVPVMELLNAESFDLEGFLSGLGSGPLTVAECNALLQDEIDGETWRSLFNFEDKDWDYHVQANQEFAPFRSLYALVAFAQQFSLPLPLDACKGLPLLGEEKIESLWNAAFHSQLFEIQDKALTLRDPLLGNFYWKRNQKDGQKQKLVVDFIFQVLQKNMLEPTVRKFLFDLLEHPHFKQTAWDMSLPPSELLDLLFQNIESTPGLAPQFYIQAAHILESLGSTSLAQFTLNYKGVLMNELAHEYRAKALLERGLLHLKDKPELGKVILWEMGQRELENEKWNAARKFFQAYAQIQDPHEPGAAGAALATCLIQSGDPASTLAALAHLWAFLKEHGPGKLKKRQYSAEIGNLLDAHADSIRALSPEACLPDGWSDFHVLKLLARMIRTGKGRILIEQLLKAMKNRADLSKENRDFLLRSEAGWHIQLGLEIGDSAMVDAAFESLEALAERSVHTHDVNGALVEFRIKAGRLKGDEEEVLKALIDAHPGHMPSRVRLAELYVYRYRENSGQAGTQNQYEKAINLYSALCEDAPNYVRALLGKAKLRHTHLELSRDTRLLVEVYHDYMAVLGIDSTHREAFEGLERLFQKCLSIGRGKLAVTWAKWLRRRIEAAAPAQHEARLMEVRLWLDIGKRSEAKETALENFSHHPQQIKWLALWIEAERSLGNSPFRALRNFLKDSGHPALYAEALFTYLVEELNGVHCFLELAKFHLEANLAAQQFGPLLCKAFQHIHLNVDGIDMEFNNWHRALFSPPPHLFNSGPFPRLKSFFREGQLKRKGKDEWIVEEKKNERSYSIIGKEREGWTLQHESFLSQLNNQQIWFLLIRLEPQGELLAWAVEPHFQRH